MSNIDVSNTIGRIAAEHPLSVRVFHRHGIDFCCGGKRPLKEVCDEREMDPRAILEEIALEEQASVDKPDRWDQAPVETLVDHILACYHRPLDAELPRLEELARKVHRVHHDKAPEMLTGVRDTFLALKADLEQHMMKEEQILFPMIKAGDGDMADGPISVMNHEHEDAGELLSRLRELTSDYTVPEAACGSWTALWQGLDLLERSLKDHIHLENNILFPRVLGD